MTSGNIFKRFTEAAKRIFRRSPAMIGPPPSARSMWHDPTAHAVDFSKRYAEPMDYHAAQRMTELGIPNDQIGAGKYGYPDRAFWPEEGTGGGNVPGGKLTVDSGVFNIELFKDLGPAVSSLWEKSRLRDRMDANIAHEHAEAHGASHEDAVARATETELPISERARHLLRDIAKGGRER